MAIYFAVRRDSQPLAIHEPLWLDKNRVRLILIIAFISIIIGIVATNIMNWSFLVSIFISIITWVYP